LNFTVPEADKLEGLVLRLPGGADGPSAATAPIVTATLAFSSVIAAAPEARKQTQIHRRSMLLGETPATRQVWEIVRAIQAVRASREFGRLPLRLEAEGDMAVNALYASLYAPVDELILTRLPKSHMDGPDYLNVLRILDLPQAVAMANERGRVELRGANAADWAYPTQTARKLGREKNIVLGPEK